jgi:hypothetical protein
MECREKWINFLDPAINHNDWEEWELEKLYEVHEQVGTRWCMVQKFIGRYLPPHLEPRTKSRIDSTVPSATTSALSSTTLNPQIHATIIRSANSPQNSSTRSTKQKVVRISLFRI